MNRSYKSVLFGFIVSILSTAVSFLTPAKLFFSLELPGLPRAYGARNDDIITALAMAIYPQKTMAMLVSSFF